ncbi:hypothetical protein [Micromonospora sp. KC721]|nr:hypothetical protein [Micromonospora sp. KC721]
MTDRTERSEGREGMTRKASVMTDRTERSEGREGMTRKAQQ